MESKLIRLLPKEPTGCLIKIKNVIYFEKAIQIKHFLEHLVDVCLIQTNYEQNEAYALLHSKEEVLHFMKLYKTILKNMIFSHSNEKSIEIEILNSEEEMIFWNYARKNKLKFYVW
ncbi:conserved Plasmodium protein, unknown function [Plasmodium berghei]|uniref:XRRM domain-containing protein n=1 Tax=Plasmodium berghei TaxID=5821 RepID=A0A1C6WP56_PLABE|nr:conserved Plasmodium protein, unknown function [Plasmodium berghei]SCM15310.1 conserved Plasmodium protein, unknown function [Plasmodium berghei]SCN22071.1 conserved Plasmodium protein, unknown function [Plasmodium berghei]